MRNYLTPVRMIVIKNTRDKNYLGGYGEKGTPMHHWWESKLVLWKTVWRFVEKLRVELPYDPAIPLLACPQEMKTCYQRGICTSLFIAALFMIVRIWKQPKCQSIDEWIKKIWSRYDKEDRILFSYDKEWNSAIWNKHSSCRYYAKWN